MDEEKIRKLRKGRNFTIFQMIFDPILGTIFLVAAQSGKDSYRYYFDSDYRNGMNALSVFGWVLLACTVLDIIAYIAQNGKLQELEQGMYKEKRRGLLNANLWSCPDCGNAISRAATVCPQCGRPIQPGEAKAQQAVAAGSWKPKPWRCPQCGADNPPAASLCTKCNRYRFLDDDLEETEAMEGS